MWSKELDALDMVIVTALPRATELADSVGVVALGMVTPVKVPDRLALPRPTPEVNPAATARDSVPVLLCVALKLPLAIFLVLPTPRDRISKLLPVYLRVPPMFKYIDAPSLLYELHDLSFLIRIVQDMVP